MRQRVFWRPDCSGCCRRQIAGEFPLSAIKPTVISVACRGLGVSNLALIRHWCRDCSGLRREWLLLRAARDRLKDPEETLAVPISPPRGRLSDSHGHPP